MATSCTCCILSTTERRDSDIRHEFRRDCERKGTRKQEAVLPTSASRHWRSALCPSADAREASTRRMSSSRRKEELGHQLGIAAKTGNMSSVLSLLAAGAEKEIPTVVSGMMMTPLNAAAFTNNGRIVRALLKAGANVNAQQSTGHTPLHCCAMEGQECMMKDLLDAGANPTLASVEGQTALHTAAQWGHARECTTLVNAGAKIDARCQKGYTLLRLAAWKGTAAAVKALLDAGADFKIKDFMGYNILTGAFQNQHYYDEIVQLLLAAGADPDTRDPGHPPPVFLAVSKNNPALMRSLVAAGANPNLPNAQGISAVSFAAQQGHSGCLAVLLSSGGSPRLLVKTSLPTPLQWAIIGPSPTCVALLLGAGADPEDRHAPSVIAAQVEGRLSKKYRPGTLGARTLRVLRVAGAYGARSWQWDKEEKDGGGEEEAKMTGPANLERGAPASEHTKPFAGARWIAPGRGVFVPAVLRYVSKLD